MALLVDGSSPAVTDLEKYEGSISGIANTEGIDLGTKMTLARDEIATELGRFLKEQGTFASIEGGSSLVVLTEPLRRWLTLQALTAFFREARLGQVSDRYAAKFQEYSQLAYQAKHDLMSSGIGVVWNPLRKPGQPTVSSVPGSLPAGTYFVRASWVGPAGAESESSDPVAFTLASAGGIRVSLDGGPSNAAGFNVYVGQLESEVTLQNATPALPGVPVDVAAATLANGKTPSAGQLPDVLVRVFNSLLRG